MRYLLTLTALLCLLGTGFGQNNSCIDESYFQGFLDQNGDEICIQNSMLRVLSERPVAFEQLGMNHADLQNVMPTWVESDGSYTFKCINAGSHAFVFSVLALKNFQTSGPGYYDFSFLKPENQVLDDNSFRMNFVRQEDIDAGIPLNIGLPGQTFAEMSYQNLDKMYTVKSEFFGNLHSAYSSQVVAYEKITVSIFVPYLTYDVGEHLAIWSAFPIRTVPGYSGTGGAILGFETEGPNGSNPGGTNFWNFGNHDDFETSTVTLTGSDIPKDDDKTVIGADYYTFKSCDAVSSRNIILLEGIDATNDNNLELFEEQFGEMRQLFNQMGYNVSYVNFHDGGDYLLNNAAVVKEILREINSSQDERSENVLVGVSMGGIIARIALKQMEDDPADDHNARLYFSIDAPHTGAHIPVGFQMAVAYLKDWMETCLNVLGMCKAPKDDENGQQGYAKVSRSYTQLTCNAAKDLLEYYFGNTPHPNFVELQALLTDDYWPSETRNIAITNGSMYHPQVGISPGSLLFEGAKDTQVPLFQDIEIDLRVWAESQSLETVFEIDIQAPGDGDRNYSAPKIAFPQTYADLPGGQFSTQNAFKAGGFVSYDVSYHCFVPTQSAFGFQVEDLDMTAGDYYQGGMEDFWYKIVKNKSPFDEIYYDSENDGMNGEHTFALNYKMSNGVPRYQDELQEIFFHEMMINEVRLQDRDYNEEHAVTSLTKVRVSGDMPNYNDNDDWISDKKGDVNFEQGSDVQIRAGQSVVFTPGVKVDRGARMNVFIEGDLVQCGARDIYVVPETGDNTKVSSESLEVIEVADFQELIVYPNPTLSTVNVDVSELTGGFISVTNTMGQTVFEEQNIDAQTIQFDLTGYEKGIYLIHVIREGTNISQKVMLN